MEAIRNGLKAPLRNYLLVTDGKSSFEKLELWQRLAQIYSFFDEKGVFGKCGGRVAVSV